MATFDLTPDPKVLIALTHTAIQPLDALCELIDNAIDSFQIARLRGITIEHPLIIVELPRPSELGSERSRVLIRDNGPGMAPPDAEKAIRAGFSGNNPYDSLGLFGMGFNISTGKLGRVTRFMTATQHDSMAVEVVIDLDQLRESRSYQVPYQEVEKLSGFEHGTLVEISGWWPEGNPNHGFVRKLIQYGMPRIRDEIGRRYATILRERRIRILINNEPCHAFEHCVWADSRSVKHRSHGVIPAVFRFNELIGSQRRCSDCVAQVPQEQDACPACGSRGIRTLEERIRGWVGIQRFDDQVEYGVDLIRNGRAIRVGEKSAFFEFADEFKKVTKDYPIDGPYGRIVGEVHLDHVPVDFMKQDFQRSSQEWQRAMSYLRGESSLQPTQPNADSNKSPIFRLYQGYRRVRVPGTTDLYMGFWDPDSNGPKRISRDVEKEYYERFKRREPGYYDDSEWWKLVEHADQKPIDELVECPSCASQNLKGHDACSVCGGVLIGKECIHPSCSVEIPASASSCPHCGGSQIPEVEEPWRCLVCNSKNVSTLLSCSRCAAVKGAENPLSREYLIKHSYKSDELSFPGCSIQLADGSYSHSIDVLAYVTQHQIIPHGRKQPIPLMVFKGETIELFLDLNHTVFKTYRVRPEQMIAAEVALYIYDANKSLSGAFYGIHTLSNLEWAVLTTRWANKLEDNPERVREDTQRFLANLKDRLPSIADDAAGDIYAEMDTDQKRLLVENLQAHDPDLILQFGEMKETGEFLRFLDPDTLVLVFQKLPGIFFDGKFWNRPYKEIPELPSEVIDQVRKRTATNYRNCLEDLASFLRYRPNEPAVVQRARASLDFLQQNVV